MKKLASGYYATYAPVFAFGCSVHVHRVFVLLLCRCYLTTWNGLQVVVKKALRDDRDVIGDRTLSLSFYLVDLLLIHSRVFLGV